jgi:hypothetical protein
VHHPITERAENLKTCLSGRYPRLCDYSQLTQVQISQVRVAEATAANSQKKSASPVSRRTRAGSADCESGHWVESVMDDGRLVKLEDGSLWHVDAVDAIDSALWLPMTDIVVCDTKLINTDDNEVVSAGRIR